MIARPLLGVLVSIAACGGADHPAPAAVEAPSVCVADAAVAATRRPRPAGTGCMSAEAITALGHDCNGGDVDACDRMAGCQLFAVIGDTPDPAAVTSARAALRLACDGGIAESCRLRVGVAMNDGSPLPADGCADLIRGCQLGDDQSCFDCSNACN